MPIHAQSLVIADIVFCTYVALLIVGAAARWVADAAGGLTTIVLVVTITINLAASVWSRSATRPQRVELIRAALSGPLIAILYALGEGPFRGWWGPFLFMSMGGGLAVGLVTRSAATGRLLVCYYVLLFVAAELAGRSEHDWFAVLVELGTFATAGLFVVEAAALLGRSLAAEREQRRELERARTVSEHLTKRQLEAAGRASADSALRIVVEDTAGSTGQTFFTSLVRSLAAALDVKHAFVAEIVGGSPARVRTLAFSSNGQLQPAVEYTLAGTPCEGVVAGDVCFYPQRVQARFPSDADLAALGAESYLGSPLVNARGEVLGHVAVLDDRPMWDDTWRLDVLRIFGARAGAELERQRLEHALRGANVPLQRHLTEDA